MTSAQSEPAFLRPAGHDAGHVRPIDLFFDLVYVLAITQLTHHLVGHLDWRSAAETGVMFVGVWAGWINTAWMTNYFEVRLRGIRIGLLLLMLAGLIMSASIPEAFESRGLPFAIGLSAVLCGGTGWFAILLRHRHRLSMVLERVLVWWAAVGIPPLLVQRDSRSGPDGRPQRRMR